MTDIDILAKLYASKAEVLERERKAEPLERIEARAESRLHARRSLRGALERSRGPAIIAEIKRASPSRGLIVRDLDPATIAKRYEKPGANAIGVLTEPALFLGDLAYLDLTRDAPTLPVLR